jgi:succinate dehydrogenase / fumarate reductase cytochrome b subunit
MGLLGTLLLIFLIVHVGDFWVKSRITGLDEITVGQEHMHDLYVRMKITFSNIFMVIVYCLAMISLAYHLMHGFQSAFQTLGWNHSKYTPMIKGFGKWFSIIMAIGFAIIPIVIYLRHN